MKSRAEIDAAIDRVIFDAPGDARVAKAAGVPVAEVRRRRREHVLASIRGEQA